MERLLQEIIDMLPVGVWVADVDGRVVRLNRAARRIWGAGEQDRKPEHFRRYKAWWLDSGKEIRPSEWALVRAIREGVASEGQLIRIRCFDGTSRVVLNSAAPLYDAAGRLTGAVAINEDVTELEEARRRSQQREQLLETVLDLLPVGVILLDEHGRIERANPAARRLWGIDEENPLPDPARFRAWHVVDGEQQPHEWAALRALRDGCVSRYEVLEIESFDGTSKAVINHAAPLRGADGRLVGAISVSQDVSSLYRTQRQLRAAVRDREQLLAVVAHDLRSPLTAASLSAEMLREGLDQYPGAGELQELTEAMLRRLQAASWLVDDLLAVAVGSMVSTSMLRLERMLPEQVVAQAFDQHRDLFYARNTELRTHVAKGLPALSVDPRRLQRVLANLLDNALKHTAAGGTVSLCAASSGPAGVLFSVCNTGAPLDAGHLEQMFQPFWRVSYDGSGAGLGLAISRAVVEAHGGSIWAEAAPGQCVCIRFELPRMQPQTEEVGSECRADAGEEAPAPTQGKAPGGAG